MSGPGREERGGANPSTGERTLPTPTPERRPDDDELADEIVGSVQRRIDEGERIDFDAVIAQHPALQAGLRDRFAALRILELASAGAEPPPAPTWVGRRLGAYDLKAVTGCGGMGTVYEAIVVGRVPGLVPGSRVAVKVIHPHLLSKDRFLHRFLREAEVGRRVRHPNVVRTLGADQVNLEGNQVPFVVMEYVEGQTLRSLVEELEVVPEDLCRHVGREVAKGLSAIHAAGAVHRDVKPENVLITKDHVVKVMDLGVAREADGVAVSQTGAFVGSLLYAAPEQFRTRESALDGRADLYALGLLLYELSTGRHPFADQDVRVSMQKQLNERVRPAAELNARLSPFFEQVLARLLEQAPEQRFASAEEVAQILEAGESSAWWTGRASELRAQTQRPLRRIVLPRETVLYGREGELGALRRLFDEARDGAGRVALVEGEAGIGKSRLVDELLAAVQRDSDVNVLIGGYPPGGAATVSGAFTAAYREHLGDGEDALRAVLPQTPLLVPAFRALLRGDAPPPGEEPLNRVSLQTVFVHVTRSLAAQRPTVVLIEDLHFAPADGLALFASLALAVPGHRILLLGTSRPGLDGKWVSELTSRPQTFRLALARLGPKELVHLLRDALRSGRLAEQLSALIAVKSDGNPFFVFELLRGLREGQFLVRRPDGTWDTTQVIRDVRVPESIMEIVRARVDALDPLERNLLDVAACVGFEFDPTLVATVLSMDVLSTLQALARIEAKHRVVRSFGRRYVFDHHQVQEVLYAALFEPLRERYHAGIADALEARTGAASKDPKDLDGALCTDLAEHHARAATGAPVLRYLNAALAHLERAYLNERALALMDRALAFPDLVTGSARAELLVRKARRLNLLGRRDAQRAALDEALSLAEQGGEARLLARVAIARGILSMQLGRYSEAQERLESARVEGQRAGDRLIEATATRSLGNVFLTAGKLEAAQAQFERGLAISRAIGDRLGEGTALGNLGIVLQGLGRFEQAREYHEQRIAISREIGDRQGEARSTVRAGTVLWDLGRYEEAREHYVRGLALGRAIGDRQTEAWSTGETGTSFCAVGRYKEAQEYLDRTLAICREIGDLPDEATAMQNLGVVLCRLGRLEDARAYLDRSLSIFRELGLRRAEGSTLVALGQVADEEDDAELASRLFEESLTLRRAIGDAPGVADSLLCLGELRRRTGDVQAARAALEEAVSICRTHGRKAAVALGLAQLACLRDGPPGAALHALPESGADGDDPLVRFLLWQATHDRAHLVEAKRLVDLRVEHAPPVDRQSMLEKVRVNREIVAAAAAHLARGGA